MKRTKAKLPLKFISTLAIISLALFLAIGYIWKSLFVSDYFLVKEVVAKETGGADLSYLKGRNIFALDLAKESNYILGSCPDCRMVRIVRFLPDRLYVEFVKRKPVALVRLYKYFAVDNSYVFFTPPDALTDSGLPLITGVETKIFGAKPGKRYNTKEMVLALNIIRQFAANKYLKNFRIQKLDVSSPASISIFIPVPPVSLAAGALKANPKGPFGFEVKISQEYIRDKIVILSGLVMQEKNNLAGIKYIDLRFNEPVIKFKETNVKQ